MECVIRAPLIGEIPALRRIWSSAFDESGDAVDAFFANYFDPMLTIAAESGGEIAAAGYLLPTGRLITGELKAPCAMIYAVATLPEYRKRGFGAMITKALIEKSRSAGFAAVTICPAGEGLFEYYGSRTDFRDYFYTRELRFTRKGIPSGGGFAELARVTEREYGALRGDRLSGVPHVEMDMRALEYQSNLCRAFGGGLFAVKLPGGPAGCAVIERQESGAVWIKELLMPAGAPPGETGWVENAALAVISDEFPAEEYLVRTPVRGLNTASSVRRFGMMSLPPEFPQSDCHTGWLGMAFD